MCYEVGSEVIEALKLTPNDQGKAHVDLRSVLAGQARRLGIRDISISPWCSAHNRDHFFSHRRSGGKDGRMVAYLGMPASN
jgi:polyphenol oxidase